MLTERNFFTFLSAILALNFFVIAYFVWKYFDKKALGMQTILDQMVKDFILIGIIAHVTWFLVLIKFKNLYGNYVAFALVVARHFTILAMLWQFFITLVIRYLSIFQNPLLNSIDDKKIINATRILNIFLSVILTLMENLEHSLNYAYLTNQDLISTHQNFKDLNGGVKSITMISMFDLLFLIIIQSKIEIYKCKVDKRSELNQIKEEDEESKFEYREHP